MSSGFITVTADLADIQTLYFSNAQSLTQIVGFPSNTDSLTSLFDLNITSSTDPAEMMERKAKQTAIQPGGRCLSHFRGPG